MVKSSKKKETEVKMKDEEEKKKIKEEQIEKIERTKSMLPKWFKFLLGSFVFLGSSIGLVLLYRNRFRFHKN